MHILTIIAVGFCAGVLRVYINRKAPLWKKALADFRMRLKKSKFEVVSRKLMIDVDPSNMRATDFAIGTIEGRLVMYGPFNSRVRSILLLWKNGKHRCIRMKDVTLDSARTAEELHTAVLQEAKDIAQAVFQKRNKKNKGGSKEGEGALVVEKSQPVCTPPPTPPPAAQQAVPVAAQSTVQAKVADSEAPILHGCKSVHVGFLVDADVQPHIKTGREGSETYQAFTVTLDCNTGREHLTGNDLKRALAKCNARAGDNIKVIHVDTVEIGGGKKFKKFEVVNLSNRSDETRSSQPS